jgi:ectoine hydroxylase
MKLTQQQIEAFEREGYVFFPGLFKPEEIKVLTDEVPRLSNLLFLIFGT